MKNKIKMMRIVASAILSGNDYIAAAKLAASQELKNRKAFIARNIRDNRVTCAWLNTWLATISPTIAAGVMAEAARLSDYTDIQRNAIANGSAYITF